MKEILESTVPIHQRAVYDVTLALVRDLSSGKIRRDPSCKFKQVKKLPKAPEEVIRRFTNGSIGENFDGATLVHFVTEKTVKVQRVGQNRYALEWLGGSKTSFATDSELRMEFTRIK